MIILDTNVISALMRPHRAHEVRAWLDDQPSADLWVTTISLFELRAGVLLLPAGNRKDALEKGLDRVTQTLFEGRILLFDVDAALHAASILARRHAAGINMETRDTQIAGMAVSRRAVLATRNVRDFQGLGIELVDPWAA